MNSISPLTRYGIAGLRRCWMPEHARWSHKYHLDGRSSPNESIPHSDLYYSLNVLLGFAGVRQALVNEPYDVPELFSTLCGELPNHAVRNGAWGMALWAAAELNLDTPGLAVDRRQVRQVAADPTMASTWTVRSDAGVVVIGWRRYTGRGATSRGTLLAARWARYW